MWKYVGSFQILYVQFKYLKLKILFIVYFRIYLVQPDKRVSGRGDGNAYFGRKWLWIAAKHFLFKWSEEVTLKCCKWRWLKMVMGKWLRNTGCEKPWATPACLKDSLTHKFAQGLLTSVPKLPNINVRSWYFDVD